MGEDAAEGRRKICVAGEGAAKIERERANEAGKHGTGEDAAKGHGAGMGNCLTGAAISRARSAGGGEEADNLGRGSTKSIIG